jgi:hypothetical protein
VTTRLCGLLFLLFGVGGLLHFFRSLRSTVSFLTPTIVVPFFASALLSAYPSTLTPLSSSSALAPSLLAGPWIALSVCQRTIVCFDLSKSRRMFDGFQFAHSMYSSFAPLYRFMDYFYVVETN